MRIYFPKCDPDAFQVAKRDARWIIAFIIICFLVGLCGSYLPGNHFVLLAIMVLGIVSILLGGAVYAWFNRNEVDGTRRVRVNKSVPQITSGWDYRPREAIRRYTAIDRAPAETAEVVSARPSARNENDYVWFNPLECSAHTFIDGSPDVPGAHDESALVANRDTACTVDDEGVSRYDLSPIDNQIAVAE
jgi:uncharacterized membrane protein YeaQ/YmgE (transglycosylase-associated protein family)